MCFLLTLTLGHALHSHAELNVLECGEPGEQCSVLGDNATIQARPGDFGAVYKYPPLRWLEKAGQHVQ